MHFENTHSTVQKKICALLLIDLGEGEWFIKLCGIDFQKTSKKVSITLEVSSLIGLK